MIILGYTVLCMGVLILFVFVIVRWVLPFVRPFVSLSTNYVCPLVKVMASKTKIYIVMELVTGGELFDKIVSTGHFSTSEIYIFPVSMWSTCSSSVN